MSERTRKLLELRAKTDANLLVLVNRELEHGLALVESAVTKNTSAFAEAQARYQNARRVLPLISAVSQFDRTRTERKLHELRSRLNHLPSRSDVRAFPFAS